MREFLKEQAADADLQGWGFKGFAANVSRWLPRRQKPAVAVQPLPVEPPPQPSREELEAALARAEAAGNKVMAGQLRKTLAAQTQ
jgi:hypothetical protein